MSKLTRERAAARRKRIENSICNWRFENMRLVAEFYKKRQAEIAKITEGLKKHYEPLEMACWNKEKAAKAGLKRLQEKDCPEAPHRGIPWCRICSWSLER